MRTRSKGSPLSDNDSRITTSALVRNGESVGQQRDLKEVSVEEEEEESSPSSEDLEHMKSSAQDHHPQNPWTVAGGGEDTAEKISTRSPLPQDASLGTAMPVSTGPRRTRPRSPWSVSVLILVVTVAAAFLSFSILQAFLTRQRDPDGCEMSYMRPGYAEYPDFDTEHTRFASKYSLYLYREGGIDDDTRVKGVPVLFIPGNAGSFRQVRSFAAESAVHFHDVLQSDTDALSNGKRPLDWFTVDFNEDLAAFHGQTLLDQAEYLNEAIVYILQLYHNPNRSTRDSTLPDPTSVIILGHSMGGIVARTMLTLPNHQTNSVNTIITLAAPHSRPPVSFDPEVISTYNRINTYWRDAYSQKWANDNPLWHVTLISIAGGSLDTIVPSDYAATASLVPATHGFTVFTSTIPNVWTGMDHLAMVWCDQLRKSVVRSLYDVIDAGRPSQTRPRADRMRSFKRWLLTGLEDVAEKTLPQREPKTLLTLEDNSDAFMPAGERFVLRQLGQAGKVKAYLLPLPPQESSARKRFTLLTDQKLGHAGSPEHFEVMFCSVFSLHGGQSSTVFSINMDLSGNTSGSIRLACKNAASDVITLPASTTNSRHPFDNMSPFSYLQFELEQLLEYQYVAVVDKAVEPRHGWVIAEFPVHSDTITQTDNTLSNMIVSGIDIVTPHQRPMINEVKIPSVQSSLLAYKLSLERQSCGDETELFTPLLRQFISEPHESKFFVNVTEAEISMHGIAPYMPPPLRAKSEANGLTFQIWSDSTCNNTLEISLQVDIAGSMGKLWMRYRTVFAAFPLLVVALVLRKQFTTYDKTGIFMSFSESMDKCLRSSVPALFVALTFFGLSYGAAADAPSLLPGFLPWGANATETLIDFTRNDLLLGTHDPFFWFLVPLFGILSIGICVILNYAVLLLTHIFAIVYSRVLKLFGTVTSAFTVSSLRRRLVVTSVLILLVWTVIPYQFLYIVLCIAQLATCVRALSLTRENHTQATLDFYNYVHSILILMLWVLPINLPTLVVWIHNLTVHWLTPFSSHHNVLSILPFVLLVETLSTGKMLPRLHSRGVGDRAGHLRRLAHHFTSILFFAMAAYAAVYGVTYAYLLHFIANGVCTWLMVVYFATGRDGGLKGMAHLLENSGGVAEQVEQHRVALDRKAIGEKAKKTP